jgi:hypothetical protein
MTNEKSTDIAKAQLKILLGGMAKCLLLGVVISAAVLWYIYIGLNDYSKSWFGLYLVVIAPVLIFITTLLSGIIAFVLAKSRNG